MYKNKRDAPHDGISNTKGKEHSHEDNTSSAKDIPLIIAKPQIEKAPIFIRKCDIELGL